MDAVGFIWKLIEALGAISAILAAVGGTVWGFLKLFGSKWIEARFSRQLEELKHEQQRELERLKFEINASLDRISTLHQHEFEALPEAWRLLHVANGHAADLLRRFQQSADVDRMSASQLTEFVDALEYPKWQKENILAAADKNKVYFEYRVHNQLALAYASHATLHNYLLEKGIFVQSPVIEKMKKLAADIWEALREKEFDLEHPMPKADRFPKGDQLLLDAPQLVEEIEQAVRARLWTAQVA